MKRHSLLRISSLAVGLLMALTGPAQGFGLNNIYGRQTIGKPFYAEIPLQAAPGVSESCISVKAAAGGSELFMPDLTVAVAGPVNARRIVITSRSAVRNPMIQFLVDVHCGESAMARQYVLLADNASVEGSERRVDTPGDARVAAASAVAVDAPESAGRDTDGVVLIAAATTLNAMARAIYPNDRLARNAYRAAFARANPERFAGNDNIGAIPLPAGTRLNAPAGIPVPASRSARPGKLPGKAPATMPAGTGAARGEGARPAELSKGEGSKGEGKKSDRLSVGATNTPLQMLTDAMLRLEASAAERDKINAELVGGVSGALNSIIELRDRISAQDEQVKQLISLRMESERLRAREKEEALGPAGLVTMLLAALLAGGGLVTLYHTLAARRRPAPVVPAGTMLNWDDLDRNSAGNAAAPRDVWAQAADNVADKAAQAMADDRVSERAHDFPSITAAQRPMVPASSKTHTTTPASGAQPASGGVIPPAAAGSRANVTTPQETKQDMELDHLLDLFGTQKAAVTATIQRLRATRSRDPDEWLGLVRQARVAGLMNSEEMQLVITEFKRLFNANVTAEPSAVGLETFPHVTRQVQDVWGRNDGVSFLNSLLFDDREGGRNGFPELCFEELVTLREVLAVRLAMFGEDPEATGASGTGPVLALAPIASAGHKNADASVMEFELPPPAANKANPPTE